MRNTAPQIFQEFSKRDFTNLIGVDYTKMNCWDLARAFYSQVLGIELKHYYVDAPQDRSVSQSLIYSNRGDFIQVTDPLFGDIITLKVRGLESHIAIHLNDGLMLHTDKQRGSYIDRVDRWSKTIVGYFRVKGGE